MAIIKPYYEDDLTLLYHADCLHDGLAKWLVRKHDVALLATDPPYGINYRQGAVPLHLLGERYRNHYPPIAGDDKPFNPLWMVLLRIPCVLWGANYFSDWLPPHSGWLVWDKMRPEKMDQAMGELAWTNCVRGVRVKGIMWNGWTRGTERGEHYHPNQKPIALWDWVLQLKGVPQKGAVIDPYCGSGSLLLSARDAGRKNIGIEISERYCMVTVKRIKRHDRKKKEVAAGFW